MKFRTEIEILPFAPEAQIGYENDILAVGSCFAGEMTARLCNLRFRCTTNPTGVVFNPSSIASALHGFATNTPIEAKELHETDGLFVHFGFHGSFSAADPAEALAKMNAAQQAGAEALRTADRVILTFGTAWVYERAGHIVANCHRRSAAEFVRRRLSVAEIVGEYTALIAGPLAGKQLLLTVSPVRHLGDGLDGNALSKAVLRLAAAEIAERHPNVHYFPAYEILIDDLRDYRFYAGDLTHPTAQAVEYVWEKFSAALLTDEAQRLTPLIEKIVATAAHRPLHPGSESFLTLCRRQIEQIDTLPQINLKEERAYFEKYIR